MSPTPADEVTMEEVGQTTQLRAGELIIIVVVLIMWAGEEGKCSTAYRSRPVCLQDDQSWLIMNAFPPPRCDRSLLSPV